MPPDRSTVDHTSGSASSWEGALSLPTSQTVAPIPLVYLLVLVDYLHVVFVDAGLQVGHASVAHFHSISVEDFAEGVVFWKVLGNYA